MDKEIRNWDVQVLDEKGNVKYQSNTTGTEKQARALLETFEKKWRDDCKQSCSKTSAEASIRGGKKFY